MINSVEQYEYVVGADVDDAHPHGDLDRIVIDGEVMPLRTGDTGKVDKDGKAIPRTKILRGEDIAFLMEAACQRCSFKSGRAVWIGYWLTGFYRWSWQLVDGTYVRVWEKDHEYDFDPVQKPMFARHFSKIFLLDTYERINYCADYALNGIGLEAKVGTSEDSDFFTDYGCGLPDSLREYKAFLPESSDVRLSTAELLMRLFMAVRLMSCSYLGDIRPAFSSLTMLGLGSSESNAHPDIEICESSGADPSLMFSGHLDWGCRMYRFAKNDEQEGRKWHNITLYGAPHPSVCFLNIEAPHLNAATALLELRVSWGSTDDVGASAKVWLPTPMFREGKKLFAYSHDTFDSANSVKSILALAGCEIPASFPEDERGWRFHADISVKSVHVIGEWDDHTKL